MRKRDTTLVEGDLLTQTNTASSYKIIRNIITGLLFLLFSQNIFPQFTTPVFENISIEDGLPENSAMCIVQDYLGYIWIGTQNGLVKYDGYSMKVFQPEDMNRDMLNQKGIVALFEDREKILWVCTLNGLFRFNRSDETFKCYKHLDSDSGSINSDLTHCIYEDKKGRLWIGTQEGLNLFDRVTEKFTRYYFYLKGSEIINTHTPNQRNLAVNALNENPVTGNLLIGTSYDGLWEFNTIKKIFVKSEFSNIETDKMIGYIQAFNVFEDNRIWMASYHRLCSLDPLTGEFISYIDFPVKNEERLWKPSFANASIIKDYKGLIWCAFNAGAKGLFCLDPETKNFRNYKPIPTDRLYNYNNKLHSVYEDRSHILWVGSWGTGFWKWDRTKYKFLTASNSLDSFNSLRNYSAISFTYDPRGFIWLSSPGGLDKYDINDGRFYHYLQNEECLKQLDVYSTFLDKSGNIWLGTTGCGLIKFNPDNGSCRYYFNDPSKPVNLDRKIISNIFQDHLGYMWVSTEGYGLFRFDTLKYTLTQFKHDPNDPFSLSQNQPSKIFEDSYNTLWIGTNLGGLDKFDRENEKFIYCGFSCVCCIYEDTRENFWVGDYFTGLNLFDRKTNKVTACYNREDGLASYSTWGVLEDKHNNLWIKTDNGLLKFSAETKRFKRYSEDDGLPYNFFLPVSQSKVPDGTLLFNTGKGLVIFNPDSIKDDPVPPQVIISNVSLFNRSDEKLDIKGFVPELKEIIIPYYDNDLRFDYVGLQYSEPLKNTYKYILENFDNGWVDAGDQRRATYTNLDPGEYVFKVIAANRDGIWNTKAASLRVIITPPLWKTSLAYFIFALILLSIVYFTWKMQVRRIRLKHAYEMGRFEAEKLHEVDEIKTRFFTNISHEFRTPLTLIMGPSRQIMNISKNDQVIENARLISRSAKKLNRLASQLLDISRIEAGQMKLRVSEMNIVPVICDMVSSFQSLAERKRITLKFQSSFETIMLYTDKDKVDKIVSNILSNAVKFTPEGGRIEVSINRKTENDKFVEISIRDTGIGIPKEQLDKIFDRFYQVDNRSSKKYEGTGVGLSLARELAELHRGKIIVESEEGRGSTFTILLPFGKQQFSQDQLSAGKIEETGELSAEFLPPIPRQPVMSNKNNGEQISESENKPSLLLIEDNSELRCYIKDILRPQYEIMEASDGEEGLKKSTEMMPDLIISDIMMPGIDGIQLCKKLRSEPETSHIPLIFLTARAALRDKLEGLETGADDYIMKPFEAEELKIRIKNLLDQKARLHEYYRKHGLFEIDEKKVTPVDRQFLQKAMAIINQHISDSSFSTEVFADSLAISRSLLNKKLKALIGEPPGELIRRVRLNKAAELMKKNSGNITEIAFDVGFNDPSYFSVCFRKQFGMSPSEYLHSNVKS
jgi:signal transduction histidine kinase/ligand-binding sensor domain-containing protein/AraC-like DNA-binding protein